MYYGLAVARNAVIYILAAEAADVFPVAFLEKLIFSKH